MKTILQGLAVVVCLALAAEASAACIPGPTTLCLNGGRFRVDLTWVTPQGQSGAGQAVALTGDTGFFWFFSDQNIEVIIKVLDGCAISNRFWVFAAGLTSVDVTLTVTDTVTGSQKVYRNPQGTAFQPVQDTAAFACASSGLGFDLEAGPSKPEPASSLLLGNRFLVDVSWKTPQGASGHGQAVTLTADTGYFWFFDPNNVEMVVKVLNACGFNDRFWVFAGGLTNVEVVMTVTDTVTGSVRSYTNAQSTAFRPVQDTSAFAACLDDTDFAMVVHPDDPLLLRAVTPTGERVEYFGAKNASGAPTALSHINVDTAAGTSVAIALDGQSRPTQALSSDGVSMDINWLTNDVIVFTATTPGGGEQATVTVNLRNPTALPTAALVRPRARRNESCVDASSLRVPDFSALRRPWFPVMGDATSGTSTIHVERCSTAVEDALVLLRVQPVQGSSYGIPAFHAGGGQYRAVIPTSPSGNEGLAREICGEIAEKLDLACDLTEGLGGNGATVVCPRVFLVAVRFGPIIAAKLFAACELAFAGIELYCDTFGQSPGSGSPSILETLCNEIPDILDRYTTEDVTLTPTAIIPGLGTFSAPPKTAKGTGPFPDFTISSGGDVRIGSLYAIPPDPAPFQDYVVTVEILCAPAGTLVEMTISGTDGYFDGNECVVSGDATCELFVPGAQAGVVDTVTVTLPNGTVKQIGLVF